MVCNPQENLWPTVFGFLSKCLIRRPFRCMYITTGFLGFPSLISILEAKLHCFRWTFWIQMPYTCLLLNIHPIFPLNTVVSFRPCPICFLKSNCSLGALPQLFTPANIALLGCLLLLYGSVRLSWHYLLNKSFVCDKDS